jgi:hypothetical protein
MRNFYSVLRETEAFNRRWLPRRKLSMREEAAMLTGASALRTHAIEAALRLREGRDRDLLLTVRDKADTLVKNSRRRLGGNHSAPGGTA